MVVSFVSEETPDTQRWVAYHLSLGVAQIVLYQPRAAFRKPSTMTALEEAGRIQRRLLSIDVGVPLKSATVLAMTDARLSPDALILALNVGEYLALGVGFKPFAVELSALNEGAAAFALPFVDPQQGESEVEFRTVFRASAFLSHNGQWPIIAKDGEPLVWLDGAGKTVDPNDLFWGSGSEVNEDILGQVIRLSADFDHEEVEGGARVSDTLRYANSLMDQQAKALECPSSEVSADASVSVRDLPEIPGTPLLGQSNQPLPEWYSEVNSERPVTGFFKQLKHHSLVLIKRPSETLVVTFDNLSAVNDMSSDRAPWGYKFLQQEGCAHLGVFTHRKDWYREPNLIAALVTIQEQGVFEDYKKVIFTGTSMGGFAALAFSSLSPGASVLAFSPQSTLDEAIVPWETRFGMGRMRNWRLPFSDAATEIEGAGQIVVISDPYFELDQRHVDRLTTPNVIKLKAWFSGHFSPVFLRRAELLKPVMAKMIQGTLTEESFYRLYRGRRKLPWYKKSLEEALVRKGHKKLALRVGPAFKKAKAKATTDN